MVKTFKKLQFYKKTRYFLAFSSPTHPHPVNAERGWVGGRGGVEPGGGRRFRSENTSTSMKIVHYFGLPGSGFTNPMKSG
jgi:hypothetical protein